MTFLKISRLYTAGVDSATPGGYPVLVAVLAFILLLAASPVAWSAVGCDLNDPDRDVARLFPGSTGYNTIYTSILLKGGRRLMARV